MRKNANHIVIDQLNVIRNMVGVWLFSSYPPYMLKFFVEWTVSPALEG